MPQGKQPISEGSITTADHHTPTLTTASGDATTPATIE
jgi:hypothetical protein